MRLSIICFSIAFFASIANCKVLSDPIKSYENYQVLRVQIDSKAKYEILSSFPGIHYWKEGRIGGNADVLIAPEEIEIFKFFLFGNRFEFSVMVENVGDLIRQEKVSIIVYIVICSVLDCCACSTRFEFWAVGLAVKAAAALLRNDGRVNALSLSFSIIDLIVDLLAPMNELLCGT